MSKDAPNAQQSDPSLQEIINHLMRSPRMLVAAGKLSQRILMLDVLDRAGIPPNNVEVRVRFQGRQVTTAMVADDVEMGGGGISRFDPDANKGI